MSLRLSLAATPAVRTAAVLSLLALVGAGISTTNPETVVTQRFAAALKQTPDTRQTVADQLVSGSEAYWLAQKRRHDTDGAALEPAAWSAPFAEDVAVGDRITISTAKAQRILKVVAVSAVEPASGTAGTRSADASRQIAVTCRDLSSPDGRLTTFLTQAGAGPAGTRTARAL
jgi:hypothetical protein